MRILLQHSQVLVFYYGSNFYDIQTLLKEPAGGLMSQVMKPEINDVSPAACPTPCTFQSFVVQGEDNLILSDIPRQVSQSLQRLR